MNQGNRGRFGQRGAGQPVVATGDPGEVTGVRKWCVMIALTLLGAALGLGGSAAAATGGGNSTAALRCQRAGYLALVGSDGQTFANVGECVSFAARGGSFASGMVIPAGQTATLSRVAWVNGPCDADTYGYQLDFGSNVPLASKAAGCLNSASVSLPGVTVGPFPTAELLRVYLQDTGSPAGSCDYVFYSDGLHAKITGSNPWDVQIADSYFCSSSPLEPRVPPPANLEVTVTVS